MAVRKAFAKQCLSELKAVSRGSGWQKRENVLFRRLDQWFVSAELRAASNRQTSWLVLRVKPFEADTLLWRITRVDDDGWPLSARAFYAAKCPAPLIRKIVWDDAGHTPRDNAERALAELEVVPAITDSLASGSFSDFVAETDEHGDFTVARALSLVQEGREEEALVFAQDCAEGRRRVRTKINIVCEPGARSRDVHELIADWIRSHPPDTNDSDGDSS